VQAQTAAVDDEAIAPKLQKLVQAYPNAAIYLSGAITVDISEDHKCLMTRSSLRH